MNPHPRADGIVDRQSWLFVRDRDVHGQPLSLFGYHFVSRAEQGVRLDWNKVLGDGSLLIHLNDSHLIPNAYVDGRIVLHHTRNFWQLGSLRADAEIYAFAPWFEPEITVQPPGWLMEYSADGYFPGGMDLSTELMASSVYRRPMSVAPQDYGRRLHAETVVYRRALFIQKYFHVRRLARCSVYLYRPCEEWLVREDLEATYVCGVASVLHEFGQFDFGLQHPAELTFTNGLIYLPNQVDANLRAER